MTYKQEKQRRQRNIFLCFLNYFIAHLIKTSNHYSCFPFLIPMNSKSEIGLSTNFMAVLIVIFLNVSKRFWLHICDIKANIIF